MNIIIDASCIIAVLAEEPERVTVLKKTQGTNLFSAACLPYEIGNSLSAMVKKHTADATKAAAAYQEFLKVPVRLIEPDIAKAVRIAAEENHYAYDAHYITCALDTGMPLFTLDNGMIKIARKWGVRCL